MAHAAKCIFQCINPRFINDEGNIGPEHFLLLLLTIETNVCLGNPIELLARLSEGLMLAERAEAITHGPTLVSLRAGIKVLCKRLQDSGLASSETIKYEDILKRCVRLISPLSEGNTIGERQEAAETAYELAVMLEAIGDKANARPSDPAAVLREEILKALDSEPDRSVKASLDDVLARLRS